MIEMHILPGPTRYDGNMIGSDVQSQARGWGSGGHTESSPELKWVCLYSNGWTMNQLTKLGQLCHQDENATRRPDVSSR